MHYGWQVYFEDGEETDYLPFDIEGTVTDKMLHSKIESPVFESDATGWTKFFHVDLRFASGIEGVEAARTKVYNGEHWAHFKLANDVAGYKDYYISYTKPELKDTFSYEALDSFSDPFATQEKLDQIDSQLQSLLEEVQTL